MNEGTPPFILLTASAPRTGSTWTFNAARLILACKFPAIHAAWSADYDPASNAPCHIVKAHQPSEAPFVPSLIVTSRRDLAESLASRCLRGWVKDDPASLKAAAAHHAALADYWSDRADYEVDYARISGDPHGVIAEMADCLGVNADLVATRDVVSELASLAAPETEGYDKVTLLHRSHRSDPHALAAKAREIKKLLAPAALNE